MIKLLDIIEEGTLILTPEERQQAEAMIPEIIKVISEPDLIPLGQQRNIGTLKYKYADGEDGEVLIGVGTFEPSFARGAHWAIDRNNKTDNLILIQQAQFKQYFPSDKFAQKDQELYRTFSGTANTGVERLRQTLKHEIIHAKDPALHHHFLKEPYNNSDNSSYYKSWAEFQTFTGQFFESLISGTDRVLSGVNTAADLKRVESALANILQFFAGKTKTISIKTAEFIDGTGSRNIFQKIFNFLGSITGKMPKATDFALSEYIAYLNSIKQYNPEGYKEFLKDLYKTIKSIEEKVNSVSPMKIKVQEMKSNINEVKRMQFLAGIINESEQHGPEMLFEEANDDDIEKAIAKVLKIDPSKIDLDKIEKNEEPSKEDVKESVVALSITIAGLIPPALELVGTITNWVKRNATKWTPEEKQRLDTINQNIEEKKKEAEALDKANDPREKQVRAEIKELIKTRDTIFGSRAGNFMKEWGEKLHHAYVWPIKKMLDGIAWYQRFRAKFYNDDKPLPKFATDEHLREKIANIIYATIMMTIAGVGAYSHLKHLAGVATVATTIADSVKAGKSAADILKDVLSFV